MLLPLPPANRLSNALTITIQSGGQSLASPPTLDGSLDVQKRLMMVLMKKLIAAQSDPQGKGASMSANTDSNGRVRTEGSWRPYVG
jgi:hypothetical protein